MEWHLPAILSLMWHKVLQRMNMVTTQTSNSQFWKPLRVWQKLPFTVSILNLTYIIEEVRVSSAALLQAVNFLKTNSDRIRGWAGLLDACRTISGDTVYILQLVYGAELQKYDPYQEPIPHDIHLINLPTLGFCSPPNKQRTLRRTFHPIPQLKTHNPLPIK